MSDEPRQGSDVWNVDSLIAKAQRYAESMLAAPRDEWQFAFWSSLTLEFLLRAALADYSPALLADPKDWNNLLSAVGYEPSAKRFAPKSIATKDVIDRLATVVPKFNSELVGFSQKHISKRNAELHSGQNAFDGIKHSTWLPLFYKTCSVLLKDLGRDLPDVFGDAEAVTAAKLIAVLADDAAKSVKATINAHETVWSKKEKKDREKASEIATLWATKHSGHRVKCPACKSDAIVTGDPVSPPGKTIKGDIITEKQEYLPSRFECVACGMKIAGLSQLNGAGLGDTYTQTQSYDAAEYYSPGEQEWDGWEPDNNEPN